MKRTLFAMAILAITAAVSPSAHHSYSAYHQDQIIEVAGVVEQFEWTNPHSLLKVRTPQALYTFEWRAPNGLSRIGLDSHAFKAGDRVVVRGNPRRDIADSGVANLKGVRRIDDGWSWPSPWPVS